LQRVCCIVLFAFRLTSHCRIQAFGMFGAAIYIVTRDTPEIVKLKSSLVNDIGASVDYLRMVCHNVLMFV
jgi:hypothetical protein